MALFTLVLAFVSAAVQAAQDKSNDAVKKEAEKLQGIWHVVSASVAGVSAPWMELKDAEVTITGQELAFKKVLQTTSQLSFFRVGNDTPIHRPVLKSIVTVELKIESKDSPPFQYLLDATTNPKRIDFQIQKVTLPGIYALENNQLKICFALPGADRPKELSAHPKRILLVIGRKKPDQEARNKSVQREQERMKGTWTVESGRYDTEKLTDKDLNGFRLIFGDEGLNWEEAGAAETLAVQLDPGATPAAIDLTVTGGPNRGRTIRGIYQLEQDRLTLRLPPSFSEVRPKDLKEEKGVDAVLILKRAKP